MRAVNIDSQSLCLNGFASTYMSEFKNPQS